MVKVLFENNRGVEKLLTEVNDVDEAYRYMYDFLDAHKFHSPYCRACGLEDKSGILVDVGSYTEFFRFKGAGVYDSFYAKMHPATTKGGVI